jgi:hypothetical protein
MAHRAPDLAAGRRPACSPLFDSSLQILSRSSDSTSGTLELKIRGISNKENLLTGVNRFSHCLLQVYRLYKPSNTGGPFLHMTIGCIAGESRNSAPTICSPPLKAPAKFGICRLYKTPPGAEIQGERWWEILYKMVPPALAKNQALSGATLPRPPLDPDRIYEVQEHLLVASGLGYSGEMHIHPWRNSRQRSAIGDQAVPRGSRRRPPAAHSACQAMR